MHRFDKETLIEKRLLPLTEENGLRIKKMYMMDRMGIRG